MDERLRRFERAWKESGDEEAHARLLTERVRSGDLTQDAVELATFLGSTAAAGAVREYAKGATCGARGCDGVMMARSREWSCSVKHKPLSGIVRDLYAWRADWNEEAITQRIAIAAAHVGLLVKFDEWEFAHRVLEAAEVYALWPATRDADQRTILGLVHQLRWRRNLEEWWDIGVPRWLITLALSMTNPVVDNAYYTCCHVCDQWPLGEREEAVHMVCDGVRREVIPLVLGEHDPLGARVAQHRGPVLTAEDVDRLRERFEALARRQHRPEPAVPAPEASLRPDGLT